MRRGADMDCSAPIYARKRAKTKGSRMITEECQHCRGIGGYTSQQNPARIVELCGACGGAGEIEVVNEWVVSPDCRDSNCHKCSGDAWDDDADELTECEHECHEEQTND